MATVGPAECRNLLVAFDLRCADASHISHSFSLLPNSPVEERERPVVDLSDFEALVLAV